MSTSPLERAAPPRALRRRALIHALRFLPRGLASRAAGRWAELQRPRALVRWQIRRYARRYGVDLAEAREPIESFASLQAFFTRALRADARPLDPDPRALVSPCDGAWGEAGAIRSGLLLQLKGASYSLARLLANESDARSYEGGQYATLYLAPRDYHRFHSPADVSLERALHVPGTLWPVNRAGLEGIAGVFARNERTVCHARSPSGPLCLVAVGALLVGRIRLSFDSDLSRRAWRRSPVLRDYSGAEPRLARGAEWGRFELGSTLVLLLAPGTGMIEPAQPGTPVRMGQRIGRLTRS
jgi:phosphatidylserine decarboxylase